MSNYRSMIDQALEAARARAHTPVETSKVASAFGSPLIKEAEEVAGALEFLSLSASGGDAAAAFRQEMIRDFYKTATSSPAQGPTVATGTQGIAPSEGKTRLAPKGLVGGNSPAQGAATPEAKDGEKPLRESFKQAGGQSLYDVLMNNKTAGMGGPAEHDSETMAGVSTQNENSTYRKTLHTNEGPVNANRRELKKNTRARLSEAFGHTSDTLGDATASQIFPQAASRGHLKVSSASSLQFLLEKVAGKKEKARKNRALMMATTRQAKLDAHLRRGKDVNEFVFHGDSEEQIQRGLHGKGGEMGSLDPKKVLPHKDPRIQNPSNVRQLPPSPGMTRRSAYVAKQMATDEGRQKMLEQRRDSLRVRKMRAAQRRQEGYAARRAGQEALTPGRGTPTGRTNVRPPTAAEILATGPRGVNRRKAEAMPEQLKKAPVRDRITDTDIQRAQGTVESTPKKYLFPLPLARRDVPASASPASASPATPTKKPKVDVPAEAPTKGRLGLALGIAGGLGALGAGGYYLNKRRTEARRGKTKTASQTAAGIGGALFGPGGAALGADDGSRFPAAMGSLAGTLGGGLAGAMPGVLARSPEGAILGAGLGATVGGGIGGYLGHGRDKSAKERLMRLKMESELQAAKMRGEV
jgi:hypothetical protein